MNRDEFGARQQAYTFHGVQHREIGLRAVAAAVLYYQGGNAERTVSHELPVPPAAAAPSGGHDASAFGRRAFPSRDFIPAPETD